MKLTREECVESIETITSYTNIGEDICSGECIGNEVESEIETLKQLIKEHFDNPPVKFEELKEGMWVWDDDVKTYVKIFKKFIDDKGRKVVNFHFGNSAFKNKFEDGRYYVKELK